VLAQTLEAAQHAAELVRYRFAEEAPIAPAKLEMAKSDLAGEPFREPEQIWLGFVAGYLPGSVKRGAANGMAAHSMELDDTFLPGSIHNESFVFSPRLALAEEHGIGGKRFIVAIVAGFEVACRLQPAPFGGDFV
jgi:2-methylcitrate dehydratase PrpD